MPDGTTTSTYGLGNGTCSLTMHNYNTDPAHNYDTILLRPQVDSFDHCIHETCITYIHVGYYSYASIWYLTQNLMQAKDFDLQLLMRIQV